MMKKILVTGSAGFIGSHIFNLLLTRGYEVVGLDNLNNYYDVNLKLQRLQASGFDIDNITPTQVSYGKKGGAFYLLDLEDRTNLPDIFRKEGIDMVCHLAAQAGVRYSMENPFAYISSNITGFLNLLECCRNFSISHMVYASSSSVYGNSSKMPFSTSDRVDLPISLYAATKKSDELMAHCYSYLYKLPVTGLRFFTVYGPWGRPDMALFKFTNGILNHRPIDVYNNGQMKRDFTYVDDIVEGVFRILDTPPKSLYNLYNIGNGKPIALLDFIHAIEKAVGNKAVINMKPLQPGDVLSTWADTTALQQDYDFHPSTSVEDGVATFVQWHKEYYKLNT